MQARAILLSRSAFNKQALPSHSPHRYAPTLSAPSNLGRGCYDLVANVTALEDVASTPELEIAAEKPRTATPTSNCMSPYSGTSTHGDSWGARIMVKHNENGKAKQVPMLGHLKRLNPPARSKLSGVSGSVGTPAAARHFVMVRLANIGGPNSVGKGFQVRLPSIQRSDIIKRYYATKGKRRKEQVSTEEAMFDEKHAALEDALAQISSTFGKGTVMWLGRNVTPRNVPVISTGSLSLDAALGVGGLPKGRVVEIYGPEASGKTTLALHVIAEAQKAGGYCVFIDAEHALDPSFAEALGVRTENLLLAQPDCGEQALSLTDTFIRSGSIDVIVVDSVAALVPRAELDGEMGDAHMAVQARLMSQALRKLAHSLAKAQTILIFINQIRAKLASGGYGGVLEVTSGGNALKFYASVRLNIRRTGFIKKGEETLGSSVSVKVAKNKVAPPFKTAEFEIEFGKGISKEGEIADFAIKFGLIGKSGNWYSYNGQHIANGKENLKTYLRGHTDLRDILLMKIRQNLISGQDDDMSEQELDLLERQDDVDVVVEEEEKVEAVVTS